MPGELRTFYSQVRSDSSLIQQIGDSRDQTLGPLAYKGSGNGGSGLSNTPWHLLGCLKSSHDVKYPYCMIKPINSSVPL